MTNHAQHWKSFLAAEAIATYVEAEDWQLAEIAAGLAELDSGKMVEHEKVVKWLRSWGKPPEGAPPRSRVYGRRAR